MFPVDPPVVERGMFHAIPSAAIGSKNELKQLMSLMYDHPERDFFIYFRDGEGVSRELAEAEQNGYLLLESVTSDFYDRPKFKNDWVRIRKNKNLSGWERQVVEQGPMYRQVTVALSALGRRKVGSERSRFMTRLTLTAIWATLIGLPIGILGLLAALSSF